MSDARGARAGAGGRDEQLVRIRREQLLARLPRRRSGAMRTRIAAWCRLERATSRDWPGVGASARGALLATGVPDAAFLPPMQRPPLRRTRARMMLHVSHGCGAPSQLAALPVVFASRHGPIDTTVALLADLAAARTALADALQSLGAQHRSSGSSRSGPATSSRRPRCRRARAPSRRASSRRSR
jgi:hypothetical protein